MADGNSNWAGARLRDTWKFIRAIANSGTGRYCPVCDKTSRRFLGYGIVTREDAMCPQCGSLERHRMLWHYLSKTDLFDGAAKKMLHVAPEACLTKHFAARLGERYITADLMDPQAMVKMDVTDIQFPNETFDVIYCSHVLEHVPDDRKALREFHRVLKDEGWAIILVPITAEATFEDESIRDPAARLKVFGQVDHVRRYGPDYADRLRDAGFELEITRVSDVASAEQATRMGLTDASGDIYFCTKR